MSTNATKETSRAPSGRTAVAGTGGMAVVPSRLATWTSTATVPSRAAPVASRTVRMTGLAPPDQMLEETMSGLRSSATGAAVAAAGVWTGASVVPAVGLGVPVAGLGVPVAVSASSNWSVAAIGSACVPNGKCARSMPWPSTRKMSAV